MREIERRSALREIVHEARCSGKSVGLVPTMGYLHAGHMRLADVARAENDLVVMSVYVNPARFGPGEDLERYPRDLEHDRRLANEMVDVLFVPSTETMYPEGPAAQQVWVDPGKLAAHLCGASRPGHFRGVATLVAKLFSMCQPDRAYFGQKDAQQAAIVSHMARDLAFPVEIRIVPTVREANGLALSSRNAYLSADEREQALVLWRALSLGREAVVAGELDASRVEGIVRRVIADEAPLARVDYVSVVDLETLQPLDRTINQDVLIAVAVYIGSTRLIDNVVVHPDGSVAFLTDSSAGNP